MEVGKGTLRKGSTIRDLCLIWRNIDLAPGCQNMCEISKITGTVARTLSALTWEKLNSIVLTVALQALQRWQACYCNILEKDEI